MYPGGPMRYPPPPPLPPPGSGYPSDSRYPPPMPMDSRYPMDRYPPSDSRYPAPDSRYPADARYPPTQPDAGGRYPPGPAPDSGRYPPPESGRYPPPDSGRYPPPVQRPDSRYPVMAPPATRYPPPQYMPHMYGSAVYPVVPSRAPPNRGYGPDPYPAPAGARPIDNNRYPPAPDARYPLEPVGAQGRYPTSPNVSPFHKYMTGPGRPSGKLPVFTTIYVLHVCHASSTSRMVTVSLQRTLDFR